MNLGLVDAYETPTAPFVLYALLKQRPEESRISHRAMPSEQAHVDFFKSRPYRFWYLVEIDNLFIGEIHVTENNEIGIFMSTRHRGKGYGSAALALFMAQHEPMPAIPAKRIGKWLANVSPSNERSAMFFRRHGFRQVQITLAAL